MIDNLSPRTAHLEALDVCMLVSTVFLQSFGSGQPGEINSKAFAQNAERADRSGSAVRMR
jgi:hypothetical protein